LHLFPAPGVSKHARENRTSELGRDQEIERVIRTRCFSFSRSLSLSLFSSCCLAFFAAAGRLLLSVDCSVIAAALAFSFSS